MRRHCSIGKQKSLTRMASKFRHEFLSPGELPIVFTGYYDYHSETINVARLFSLDKKWCDSDLVTARREHRLTFSFKFQLLVFTDCACTRS